MAKNKIYVNFDFRKMARKLNKRYTQLINDMFLTNINKAIQQGIDNSKDINGTRFERIKDSTIEIGNNTKNPVKKPLNRTGNMRKTKLFKATTGNLLAKIEMAGKSKGGKLYGQYHNKGFTTSPNSAVPNKDVPKRNWFGIHEDFRKNGKLYKKFMQQIYKRIVSDLRIPRKRVK
tara:strand:- start:1405 stop:1929 length:525 start_codon:yes stop_codon:yes gene_type:complete